MTARCFCRPYRKFTTIAAAKLRYGGHFEMKPSLPLLLAVDSGNTRIQWGLHDGQGWVKQGVAEGARGAMGAREGLALLDKEWEELEEPSQIMVSNVGGTEVAEELSRLFFRWQAKPQWITAVAYQCGVRNYYAEPSQL